MGAARSSSTKSAGPADGARPPKWNETARTLTRGIVTEPPRRFNERDCRCSFWGGGMGRSAARSLARRASSEKAVHRKGKLDKTFPPRGELLRPVGGFPESRAVRFRELCVGSIRDACPTAARRQRRVYRAVQASVPSYAQGYRPTRRAARRAARRISAVCAAARTRRINAVVTAPDRLQTPGSAPRASESRPRSRPPRRTPRLARDFKEVRHQQTALNVCNRSPTKRGSK